MREKITLFMDIDGVLFSRHGYKNWIQLRPNALGFLLWCTEHFDVRWLTSWLREDIESWLLSAPSPYRVRDILYTDWLGTCSDKVDAINIEAEHWYWVEDGISEYAMNRLKEAGRADRYIAVPFDGEHALEGVRSRLGSILEAEGYIG